MAEVPEEKLEEIIQRLKRGEKPRRAPERPFAKAAAPFVPPAEEFDWRRPRREFGAAKGFFALVGKLYLTFEKPLVGVATQLSKLSAAKNLGNTLDSAGMGVGPETYLVVVAASALGIAVFVAFLAVLATIGTEFEQVGVAAAAPLALASFIFATVFGVVRPSLAANARALALDRDMPFALRQLATQARAGVSFTRALSSVAESNYGVLSEEFRKVMTDLNRGATTEEALLALASRTRSTGLKRSMIQIVRAIRTGGSLSPVLSMIASDIAFETRMRIRDFTEKLNLVSVAYIMIAVVAPVGITILSVVLQLPMFAGLLPPYMIAVAYVLDMVAMGAVLFAILRMEPT